MPRPSQRNTAHQRPATSTPNDLALRFTTSWLLPPFALCAIRLLIAIYILTTLIYTLVLETTHGAQALAGASLTYFTILGYWGLGLYYLVSAAHTGIYALRGRSWLQDWAAGEGVLKRGLFGAHRWYWASVTVFPFVVTIIFWAFLARGALYDEFSTWNNISEHALNSVFAFFEILVSRAIPAPWWHLVPLVVVLAMYLGLTYVSHAIRGYYVYPFLDPSKTGHGLVAAFVVGILVLTAVMFVVVRYAVLIRKRITESIEGKMGKFSRHDKQYGCDLEHSGRDVRMVRVTPKR